MSDRFSSDDSMEDEFFHQDPPERERRERDGGREREGGRQRLVSEFVKRAIDNTLGSVHSTSHLSKDALQYLLQQGDRGRRQFLRIVANEVGEFLRNTDLSNEVVKILAGVEVELKANVRFKATPDGTGVRPEPEVSISLGGDDPPAEGGEAPGDEGDEAPED